MPSASDSQQSGKMSEHRGGGTLLSAALGTSLPKPKPVLVVYKWYERPVELLDRLKHWAVNSLRRSQILTHASLRFAGTFSASFWLRVATQRNCLIL